MVGKVMTGGLVASMLALAISAGGALAEDVTTAVQFRTGQSVTSVTGSVYGGDKTSFTLAASAGQVLSVTMYSDNPSNHFSVLGPDGGPVLFDGATQGKRANVTVPSAGTYTVQAYLAPDAAQQGAVGRFTLDIALGGQGSADQTATAAPAAAAATAASTPTTPAPAAVSAGNPEFWQVNGITGPLNIRQDASRSAAVLAGVTSGTLLRNQGCKPVDGMGWCQVQTTSGAIVTGWVAQQYLSAAAGAAASVPPAAAAPATAPAAVAAVAASTGLTASQRPVPRSGKPATSTAQDTPATTEASGKLPCSVRLGMPTRDCDYRVQRQGPGNATITVAWPDGGSRDIRFEVGRPVVQAGTTTERRGDLTVINVGQERYEIPDSVVSGG